VTARLVVGAIVVLGGALFVSAPTTTGADQPVQQTWIETAPPSTTASTTTTTVDLPFLNTTTTTQLVPKPVPAHAEPSAAITDKVFFECIRWRESRGDYTVSDSTNTFHGAYQIYQGGWDAVAASIGRHDLVGVEPHVAAPEHQDLVAQAMFDQYGSKPWGGACE
jgi:hypothetical protein